MGVDGGANRATRAREFAAQMGLQAIALLAAAEGAVEGFKAATGNDGSPTKAAPPTREPYPAGRRRTDGSPRHVRTNAGAERLPPLSRLSCGNPFSVCLPLFPP